MPAKPRPAVERVLDRIVVTSSGCWEFTGATDDRGYGRVGLDDRRTGFTHTVTWEAQNGPVPDGLELDHLCRNPPCCNPAHLEPVTHLENVRRGSRPNRTHCTNGHPFDAANTGPAASGRRCRTCNRERERARRQRKVAA